MVRTELDSKVSSLTRLGEPGDKEYCVEPEIV
jgi:hypothetical protein